MENSINQKYSDIFNGYSSKIFENKENNEIKDLDFSAVDYCQGTNDVSGNGEQDYTLFSSNYLEDIKLSTDEFLFDWDSSNIDDSSNWES